MIKRVPFVFELRDIWPESIKTVGAIKEGTLLHLLERIELFLYKRAAAVVSVTHSFKQQLIAREISAERIHVVTNGVDSNRFHPLEAEDNLRSKLNLNGCFVAGYIGTHGMAHALDSILRAAELAMNQDEFQDVRFLFLGEGASKKALVKKSIELKLTNTLFLDSVSKEEVPRYWSLLDASVVHLKKDPLFKTVIPSKIFECMGMGIPIILGVEGESAKIISENNVGLTVEPENPEQILNALRDLRRPGIIEQFRENGLKTAQKYSRSALAANMLAILQRVVKD